MGGESGMSGASEQAGLEDLIEKIRQWGFDRGLDGSTLSAQLMKFKEESLELEVSIEKAKREGRIDEEFVDAIGDVTVTLVMLCLVADVNFTACVEAAYDQIKDRKGRLVDGVFVKET